MSVLLVKIMTSSMCTGVFVLPGGKLPCCTHCSAVLFLTVLLSVFLCLFRLTWSRRGRCTWSLICLDLPLRVRLCNTLFFTRKKKNKNKQTQKRRQEKEKYKAYMDSHRGRLVGCPSISHLSSSQSHLISVN